jgi:hypothetical protein
MLTEDFIAIVQEIERMSQMQWTNREYLESDSSIYAACVVNEEDDGGLMFHGVYTNFNTLPDFLGTYNGCHLDDVARALYKNRLLDEASYRAVKAFYA